jgi:PAS domain S-box-containing protein
VQNFHGIAFRGTSDFTPIFFHGAVEKVTGYTEDEFVAGKLRWDRVIHPEDYRRLADEGAFDEVYRHPGRSVEREYRIVRKDGEVRWLRESIQTVPDAEGEIDSVQGTIVDITESRRAAQALRHSEGRYRTLFEQSSDAILIHTLDGRILDVNQEACRLFGHAPDLLRSMPLADLSPEEVHGRTAKAIEQLRAEGSARHECLMLRAEGTTFDVDIRVTLIDPERGTCQGIIRDITERKRAEREQREHTEHVEAEARRAREYAELMARVSAPGSAIIGSGTAHREMIEFVSSASHAPSPVLILGESGTGKEVMARAIHAAGPRASQPFVVLDCAALKDDLLESELFGHERGSFTGAHASKPGLAEVADGGTLFVDEIGEMPAELQSKLLRVLERGEYRRVGGVETRKADIRVVAATNRNLAAEVRAGRFREDLFYRLNVLLVILPPLRSRREDIPLLAMHFLKNSRVTMHGEKKLSAAALKRLQAYDWPGNVRELANVLERALILSGATKTITLEHLPREIRKASGRPAAKVASMSDAEKRAVEAALQACAGNKTRAAEMLGISRITLRRKIKKYGITGK